MAEFNKKIRVETTDDEGSIVGINNPQAVIEKISEIVKSRIDPKPAIHVTSEDQEGKSVNFIRNNSHMAWKKTGAGRIEKYDYAPRAYFEAVVNALIHRDYLIVGSEIHVDMYDDRLTIWSPGGMFGGGTVDEKDIGSMESRRRNPILADLFSRLLLMERRGSGLRKMIAETEKLFGYKEPFKPIFHSTRDEFRVTFWNLNHVLSDRLEETDHVTDHVTDYVEIKKKEINI